MPETDDAVLDALAGAGVRTLYQPIVDLASDSVVAYEALTRLTNRPDVGALDLLAVARRANLLSDLEWASRRAALEGALDAGLDKRHALFINVEPVTFGERVPDDVAALVRRALGRTHLVAELTERDLLARPADVLGAVHALRDAGIMIALDDVGVNPDSLTLLEFLRPDVLKLDLSLTQLLPAPSRAQTLLTVMAYCERTGALLLAEGIENEGHLEQARALGATLGQGWMFGRPAAPLAVTGAAARWPRRATRLPVASSPFALVAQTGGVRTSRKALLVALCRDIEREAAERSDPPVVLAAFQHVDHFRTAVRRRYEMLAERCPLVAVFGEGMPPEPAAGVRGAAIAPDDPITGEWTLVVLGPHYAAALIARDLGDVGVPDADRRFAFRLTHDRDLVAAAARSLFSRLAGGVVSEAAADLLPSAPTERRARRTRSGVGPTR